MFLHFTGERIIYLQLFSTPRGATLACVCLNLKYMAPVKVVTSRIHITSLVAVIQSRLAGRQPIRYGFFNNTKWDSQKPSLEVKRKLHSLGPEPGLPKLSVSYNSFRLRSPTGVRPASLSIHKTKTKQQAQLRLIVLTSSLLLGLWLYPACSIGGGNSSGILIFSL